MTTIDIHDWEGNELHKLFGDYVKNIHHRARMTVAIRTGSLQDSTMIYPTKDGFLVATQSRDLRTISKVEEFYAEKYHNKGYGPGNKPAHPYIYEAAEKTPFGINSAHSNKVVDSWVNSGSRPRIIGRLLK